MSTISFGLPSLDPSLTEEAWFPRLEADELDVLSAVEEAAQQEKEKIRSHPYPAYVGASSPEEEDDATVDEDEDQEEKSRDAHDASRSGDEDTATGVEMGRGGQEGVQDEDGGMGLPVIEVDADRVMSEGEPYTEEDADMEADDFNFEMDDNESDPIDI